jgi:toxin ParE1/3/4
VVARKCRVRLGSTAELDFANILKWTTENFGAHQSRLYRNTLVQVIGELADGPDMAGSKAREEIMPALRALHVARHGRRKSHLLLYRTQGSIIGIVRILYDRMDLERRLPRRLHPRPELAAAVGDATRGHLELRMIDA